MARTARGERFFFYMALVLLAIVVSGFGVLLLQAPPDAPPMAPTTALHGVVFLSWFVLFAVQAKLIGRGSRGLHRRLGLASLALAVLMLVTGVIATRNAIANPDWAIGGFVGPASAILPTTDLVTFAPIYMLAVLLRQKPAAHKRLMLLASLMILDPAAARLGIGLFDNPMVGAPIRLALFVALLAYDWRSLGRPHWVSIVGTVLFFGTMAARLAIGSSEGWPAFALRIYG